MTRRDERNTAGRSSEQKAGSREPVRGWYRSISTAIEWRAYRLAGVEDVATSSHRELEVTLTAMSEALERPSPVSAWPCARLTLEW